MTARVLVTGARGFIGRQTLAPLRAAGVEVHAIARAAGTPSGAASPGEAVKTSSGVTWHVGDLHDRAAVEAILAHVRPSHLLHLAWYVVPGLYVTSLENLRWVGTTLDLFEAFRRAGGARVVAAGTSAEYDPSHGPCVEARTPLRPASLYAACKRSVFDVATAWAAQTGVSFAWGRVFNLYGPGEPPDRLVPQIVRAGLDGRPFAMRHPDQVRDYLHVEDTAGALAALTTASVDGAVNVASGEPVSLGALAREVARAIGRPVTLAAAAAGPDPVPALTADAGRLRGEVGFAPRYSLSAGLRHAAGVWTRGESVRT